MKFFLLCSKYGLNCDNLAKNGPNLLLETNFPCAIKEIFTFWGAVGKSGYTSKKVKARVLVSEHKWNLCLDKLFSPWFAPTSSILKVQEALSPAHKQPEVDYGKKGGHRAKNWWMVKVADTESLTECLWVWMLVYIFSLGQWIGKWTFESIMEEDETLFVFVCWLFILQKLCHKLNGNQIWFDFCFKTQSNTL